MEERSGPNFSSDEGLAGVSNCKIFRHSGNWSKSLTLNRDALHSRIALQSGENIEVLTGLGGDQRGSDGWPKVRTPMRWAR